MVNMTIILLIAQALLRRYRDVLTDLADAPQIEGVFIF
jgi:hypothetical protein